MSEDTSRRRIDWNGEGDDREARKVLRTGSLIRKAAAPAAIGLVGLALVGALAAGPAIRALTTTEPVSEEVAAVEVPSPATKTSGTQPMAAATPAALEPARNTATAARMTGAGESSGLAADDPRWSADALTVDQAKLAELKKAVDETIAAVEIASAVGSDGTDDLFTSTIPVQAAGFAPQRPAPAQRQRSAFDAALTPTEEARPEPAAATTGDLQPAKTVQYVNMRSAPADGASVITVVPANAAIEAETDCRWCEVSYDGQKGYIFQSFITH